MAKAKKKTVEEKPIGKTAKKRLKEELSKPNPEHYEYITAVVIDGELSWWYKLNGGKPQNMRHDEDVSDWSKADIQQMSRSMLSVEQDDPVKVEVDYA